MPPGAARFMLVAIVMSMVACPVALGEDEVRHTATAVYYVDQMSCEADIGSVDLQGTWGGRPWIFVAPVTIDGARPNGPALHVKPLDVIRSELEKHKNFVLAATNASGKTDDAEEHAARLRLILAEPFVVPQEFGGIDIHVKVALRLCLWRDGAWATVRYVADRGLKGSSEFWHSRPKSARDKEFAESFRLGIVAAIDWVSQNVDGPWLAGSVVVGPTY